MGRPAVRRAVPRSALRRERRLGRAFRAPDVLQVVLMERDGQLLHAHRALEGMIGLEPPLARRQAPEEAARLPSERHVLRGEPVKREHVIIGLGLKPLKVVAFEGGGAREDDLLQVGGGHEFVIADAAGQLQGGEVVRLGAQRGDGLADVEQLRLQLAGSLVERFEQPFRATGHSVGPLAALWHTVWRGGRRGRR